MKKVLTSLILLHFAVSGNAQAVGEIAVDFTITDIEGTEHRLYDYLDQGYTVMLDLSATWCPPCWSFHESHVMKDLYEQYGPSGTIEAGKIIPLYIESDPGTGMADLEGTTPSSMGDWITGVPYPIADDASIGDIYGLTGFPFFAMICPDKTIVYAKAGVSGAMMNTDFWLSKAGECPDSGTGINNPVLEGLVLSAYPSPATDNINLSLKMDKKMDVNISVIDVRGKIMNVVQSYSFNSGEQIINIDISHLAAGMYTILVQSNEGGARFKFVKQ